MLTDGKNNEGPPPVGVHKAILEKGSAIPEINLIAYNTPVSYFEPLTAGGVKVYAANDTAQLRQVFGNIGDIMLEAPDPVGHAPE